MAKYNIYPSLLGSYTNYLASAETYQKYWGFSDNPPMTEDEWEQQQFSDLIQTLNRVPFDSPYADLGTCFNELVDFIRFGKAPERAGMTIELVEEGKFRYKVTYNGRSYSFPLEMVRFFSDLYIGGVPQQFVEGEIETRKGWVRLYGLIDELMPISVHDIKTTNRYEPWKFKSNAQHLVYPICLWQMGMPVTEFVYDIAEVKHNIKKENCPKDIVVDFLEYHREVYGFNYYNAVNEVSRQCEELIEFIEQNRDLITNSKIFG